MYEIARDSVGRPPYGIRNNLLHASSLMLEQLCARLVCQMRCPARAAVLLFFFGVFVSPKHLSWRSTFGFGDQYAAATADVFAENGQKISREIVAMMTAGVISMQMFQSKEIDMDL